MKVVTIVKHNTLYLTKWIKTIKIKLKNSSKQKVYCRLITWISYFLTTLNCILRTQNINFFYGLVSQKTTCSYQLSALHFQDLNQSLIEDKRSFGKNGITAFQQS
jgi:hypothetical protein